MGTDANFVYYVECYPLGSEDLGKGFKQEIDMIKHVFDSLLWWLRETTIQTMMFLIVQQQVRGDYKKGVDFGNI